TCTTDGPARPSRSAPAPITRSRLARRSSKRSVCDMKVIWESSDIKAGRRVSLPGRAEDWMIGYLPERHRRCLISLSDGIVLTFENAHALANQLNKTGDVPAEWIKR